MTEKEVASKTPAAAKPGAKSTMPLFQQPLPSIEFSPPSAYANPCSAKKQQSGTEINSDDDLDIKSLKPGTLLSFPVKRQHQMFSNAIPKAILEQRASTPISITSSLSSTTNSAATQLKHDLTDHVQGIEIRPEDSISNTGDHGQEDADPKTPKGKHPIIFETFASC